MKPKLNEKVVFINQSYDAEKGEFVETRHSSIVLDDWSTPEDEENTLLDLWVTFDTGEEVRTAVPNKSEVPQGGISCWELS